jgi:hypothetical protein
MTTAARWMKSVDAMVPGRESYLERQAAVTNEWFAAAKLWRETKAALGEGHEDTAIAWELYQDAKAAANKSTDAMLDAFVVAAVRN